MRKPLGALAGLVSLAALCTPMTTAEPATAGSEAASRCRVTVAAPRVNDSAQIVSAATRRGCRTDTLLRVRVKRAVPGPDPVVKSGATRSGSLALTLPCAPGVYYAVATDYRGRGARSKAVKLSCAPAGTPTPTPTTSATPSPKPSGTPTATPTGTPGGGAVGTAEENEVLKLVNAERAKGDCKPLKHDPQQLAAAFGHSSDMAAKNYFDHTSKDGRSFMDRIRAAGFTGGTAFAENIAFGQATPASVMSSWMNSSGHRANIMNCRYTVIGVGAAKNAQGRIYWTQDFAAK
ncbi:CAP domain-containing protein [Nonomuraea sp. WAC 01424]|uniref:CAP domain-containing protein n=1 Tax=Nonomuraea sp. WAC 01424 TaxID=2203200 RepID=UPI00163CC1B1|nr:CAP domain-containing protein [Nonomuraea sp. WAC 01424]